MSVKPRYDGKGSEFGRIHRSLGSEFGMFDIDCVTATAKFDLIMNEENKCWAEYRTNWTTGTCDFKAIFEVKHKMPSNWNEILKCGIGKAIWGLLKMCEQLKCRCFIVISTEGTKPFSFYEVNYNGTFQFIGVLNYYDNQSCEERTKDFWKHKLKLD